MTLAEPKKVTVASLERGDYFRRTENGPVWVRGPYCRTAGKYLVHKFDDINHESLVKPGLMVFAGFTF